MAATAPIYCSYCGSAHALVEPASVYVKYDVYDDSKPPKEGYYPLYKCTVCTKEFVGFSRDDQ